MDLAVPVVFQPVPDRRTGILMSVYPAAQTARWDGVRYQTRSRPANTTRMVFIHSAPFRDLDTAKGLLIPPVGDENGTRSARMWRFNPFRSNRETWELIGNDGYNMRWQTFIGTVDHVETGQLWEEYYRPGGRRVRRGRG